MYWRKGMVQIEAEIVWDAKCQQMIDEILFENKEALRRLARK